MQRTVGTCLATAISLGLIAGAASAQPKFIHTSNASDLTADGNSVVVEEQMVKAAETQMDYQLVTNLYRKHVDMIKTAIGRS